MCLMPCYLLPNSSCVSVAKDVLESKLKAFGSFGSLSPKNLRVRAY